MEISTSAVDDEPQPGPGWRLRQASEPRLAQSRQRL